MSLKDLRKLAWVMVEQVDAVGVGNVYISMQLKECEPNECMIYKVLHVPKLACNLFSVSLRKIYIWNSQMDMSIQERNTLSASCRNLCMD